MGNGIGDSTPEKALAQLEPMTQDALPIQTAEFQSRLTALQKRLKEQPGKAVYLHAGTNLFYFTGLKWSPSERLVGALVTADQLVYIAPHFELDTLRDYWRLDAEIRSWEEHESPYQLIAQWIEAQAIETILLDEVTPYFIVSGLQNACPNLAWEHAQPLTQSFRSRKTATELALIKTAHQATLAVIQAAASILKPGIGTVEVAEFIDRAHRKVGAEQGSSFCIVLFGVATSFPHGVKEPQKLQANDWVLIDTGFQLDGYHSDITRSFCFGQPTDRQKHAWDVERAAQWSAFEAVKLGQPCEQADHAARQCLEQHGFGPDYLLPGLPHRTGHGCGLDIHEGPNLVRGEQTRFETGMVFSNEPMLVLPGEFGVRLEDHFYLTDDGPVWVTEPCPSFEDPFGMHH